MLTETRKLDLIYDLTKDVYFFGGNRINSISDFCELLRHLPRISKENSLIDQRYTDQEIVSSQIIFGLRKLNIKVTKKQAIAYLDHALKKIKQTGRKEKIKNSFLPIV